MPGQLRATSKLLEQFLASHSLAHETNEVHERKSTKKVMKRYAVDLQLKFSRLS
jgi:hypothetical protein